MSTWKTSGSVSKYTVFRLLRGNDDFHQDVLCRWKWMYVFVLIWKPSLQLNNPRLSDHPDPEQFTCLYTWHCSQEPTKQPQHSMIQRQTTNKTEVCINAAKNKDLWDVAPEWCYTSMTRTSNNCWINANKSSGVLLFNALIKIMVNANQVENIMDLFSCGLVEIRIVLFRHQYLTHLKHNKL